MDEIQPGQIWKSKEDNVYTRVLKVENHTYYSLVSHQKSNKRNDSVNSQIYFKAYFKLCKYANSPLWKVINGPPAV